MTDGRTRGAAETQRSRLVCAGGKIDITVGAELRAKLFVSLPTAPPEVDVVIVGEYCK